MNLNVREKFVEYDGCRKTISSEILAVNRRKMAKKWQHVSEAVFGYFKHHSGLDRTGMGRPGFRNSKGCHEAENGGKTAALWVPRSLLLLHEFSSI